MTHQFLAVTTIACLFSTLAAAKVAVYPSSGSITYEVALEKIATKKVTLEGQSFDEYSLVGADGHDGVIYRKGLPEFPVIRFLVDGEGTIDVRPGAETDSIFDANIKPSLAPAPKRRGTWPRLVAPDFTLDSEEIPDVTHEVITMGYQAGVLRRLVTLYPVRWNSVTKVQKAILNFTVRVPRVISPAFPVGEARQVSALFVADSLQSGEAFKRLVTHKRRMGYLVKVFPVGASLFSDRAIREQLRQLYRNKSQPLHHALLIGDISMVPSHKTPLLDGVTDHYYRSLDTDSYTSDIGTPDIGVGRFSAQNEAQLKIIVDKQIRYEEGSFSDTRWLKRASFIATDDENHWQQIELVHNETIAQYLVPNGFFGNFPSSNLAGGDKLYAYTHRARGSDVLRSINEGLGFLQFSGHGLQDQWELPHVSNADLQRLSHPEALPVVISNACDTANFTNRNSFAENWQRNPAGSIFFWGSLDTAEWDEDEILQRSFLKTLLGERRQSVQTVTHEALTQNWRVYGGKSLSDYNWETYVTFGDPSLWMRTAPVRKLEVRSLGLNLQVRDAITGAAVGGARVVTSDDSESRYWVSESDRHGYARATLPAKAKVWVWAPNYAVYKN